jgi:hypothetical protein
MMNQPAQLGSPMMTGQGGPMPMGQQGQPAMGTPDHVQRALLDPAIYQKVLQMILGQTKPKIKFPNKQMPFGVKPKAPLNKADSQPKYFDMSKAQRSLSGM